MKTIKVNYETLDNATETLYDAMTDICDSLQTYPEYVTDYSYDEWDMNITEETRDEVFSALTNGFNYDEVDNMIANGYRIETSWDGIDRSICSADDMWHRLIDCAVEALCM